MPRLRRSDCAGPGIRKKAGRGFVYVDSVTGTRLRDRATLERIQALVTPPAWIDVWICPDERGHIQAVGTDAKGVFDRYRAGVTIAPALRNLGARTPEGAPSTHGAVENTVIDLLSDAPEAAAA